LNEAIEEFRETLRLDPGLADAHFNLAQAYKKRGLKDNAITEFEEYLRLNPGNRAALEILEELVTEDAPL
jgi:tetratricopeptide (TPR) repeat protein